MFTQKNVKTMRIVSGTMAAVLLLSGISSIIASANVPSGAVCLLCAALLAAAVVLLPRFVVEPAAGSEPSWASKPHGCLISVVGVLLLVLIANLAKALTPAAVFTVADIKKTLPGLPQASAQAVVDIFYKLDGDPAKLSWVGQPGASQNLLQISYQSPFADDYLIRVELEDSVVTRVYRKSAESDPYYADGTVYATFPQALYVDDSELYGSIGHVERMVKNNLKSPDSAKFAQSTFFCEKSYADDHMVYHITGQYTAKNMLGVELTGNFDATCTSTDGKTYADGAIVLN